MDLMDLRRSLMAMGGGNMVGELSRYEQVRITFPNAGNNNYYQRVPVSFQPKIVVMSGGTRTDGNMICGIYCFFPDTEQDLKRAGSTTYMNAANQNIVGSGVVPQVSTSEPTVRANAVCYYNGDFYISRTGANGWLSNTDEYLFEFYG